MLLDEREEEGQAPTEPTEFCDRERKDTDGEGFRAAKVCAT
jgi:hypothetical protein